MAINLASKKSNYISRVQAGVAQLLAIIEDLEALTQEGETLGYVAAAGGAAAAPLVDNDFAGSNAFLSAAVFAAVMSTLQTLDGQLHANSAAILSSLYQMRQ